MSSTNFAQDILERVDCRHLDICSVDPPGCTDIDDALHARVLPNGNYEVRFIHSAQVEFSINNYQQSKFRFIECIYKVVD